MELTIEQALQQGVAAHKEGKLEDAERLYRAILKSQPAHPDANHNLALIAVSANKADAALPLFKTALETNPKIEQFWLSYIDALIKEKQFESLKQVLEQAKKQGVAREKLNVLEAQLASINKQENVSRLSSSQQQLSNLLEHYQNGRFGDAEKLAVSFTQEFPQHPFGWKVLGAVLGQTGRKSEAVDANQTAVALSPKDAEAHYNLGVTLKELGRLEEAVASYTQAIAFEPDYTEAHNNMGVTLKELGRLDEAVASYTQAIAFELDYAEAHNNMGITLQELGRLEEAEASYTQAIELKLDFAEAHSNLGNMLKELGRLDEAEASYTQAIALKPDFAEAHSNLGITLSELGRFAEAEASCIQAIDLKPDFSEAHNNLGVLLFESGKYNLAAEQFELIDTHNSKLYAIQCSYLQDEENIFYEKFDLLVCQGEINAVIGSLGFRSEFKYGIKKSNPFCSDPLSYVVKTDLNKLYDFQNIFIETARAVLTENSVSYKAQGRLTNGVQTAGNIFTQRIVSKTEIERIIHTEIEKYRIQFKDSDEGFITSWPASYEIKGWLVSMQSGGKLSPHMHNNGWLTGSIYINVPPKVKIDCGSLVLCLSDREHALGVEKNQQSIIDVVTGNLCLFPSSLHHYTVPFDDKEDRIVLAFDVIPKK
jgi:tetratricopeptide (TPR) repeat protein